MQNKMAGGIRKIAKKTLRELRGWGSNNKKSWWCNESMQNKVKGLKVKMVCYKPQSLCKNAKNWETECLLGKKPKK